VRTVVVRRGRTKPLWMGHPWVHADSVLEVRGEPGDADPDWVRVSDDADKTIGFGLLSETSLLRVRILARSGEPPDVDALLAARIGQAVRLRRRLLPDAAVTDCCRLVHSEGDGLPGLVVDRFGAWLVAQFATAPMLRRRERLAARLLAESGCRGLLARAGGHEPEEGIDPAAVAFEAGEPLPERIEVREAGLALEVLPREGQKTGHYADQRENRVLVGALCAGADVLDLFAGSGGFSLHALRGGAASALAVDGSARALALAEEQARRNGLAAGLATQKAEVRTALADLKRAGRRFDVVVLDPPSLFPRRGPAGAAIKGYRELNVQALLRTKPGGVLATFTCSGRLPRDEFLEVLRAAAREGGVEVRVLRELGAGPDHPWSPSAPEGRYLTGFVVQVAAEEGA
jgi:23S rRNA (cytosine1962-C5)-methyltransferase